MKNDNVIYNKPYLFKLIFDEINIEEKIHEPDCLFVKDFLDRYYVKHRYAKWSRDFYILKKKLIKKSAELVEQIETMNENISMLLKLQ